MDRRRKDDSDTGGAAGGERQEDLFNAAMKGVEPLGGRRPVLRRRKAEGRPTDLPRPPRFRVERSGERVTGLLEGRRPRTLVRLRGGAFPVEQRLDLHGFTAAAARAEVEETVERAWRRGRRCLLVIHGRGRRSAAGPVLKEELPGWLTAPPLARRVVAFTSAPDSLGGAGALLVLLRVRRGGGTSPRGR
jgi:DNA-nicking Smr family endonuclease